MAETERVAAVKRVFDKKLIIDCDEDTIDKLSSLAVAAERSNAWVVRRLIEAAYATVYPGAEFSEKMPKADLEALKRSGLLGLELFYGDK